MGWHTADITTLQFSQRKASSAEVEIWALGGRDENLFGVMTSLPTATMGPPQPAVETGGSRSGNRRLLYLNSSNGHEIFTRYVSHRHRLGFR